MGKNQLLSSKCDHELTFDYHSQSVLMLIEFTIFLPPFSHLFSLPSSPPHTHTFPLTIPFLLPTITLTLTKRGQLTHWPLCGSGVWHCSARSTNHPGQGDQPVLQPRGHLPSHGRGEGPQRPAVQHGAAGVLPPPPPGQSHGSLHRHE